MATARRSRPAPPPPTPRRYAWGRADYLSTALIALAALITRFVGLTNPEVSGTPVFDEKHYAPQAYDMVESFENPFLGGIESNPGYGLVVHPPLGKQLIALGEALFGYTPLGWRFIVALAGVATVVLIMELTRRLSHSWQVAAFAGIIAVCDGVLLVSAKFGMLDAFQVMLVVAAAVCLARDHEQMRHRLHDAYLARLIHTSDFGPRLGFRWWRFGAGVLLGLALAVKWSGLYYIAFFGLMSVLQDLYLRRRYGVRRYVVGTLVRDTLPALASLVLVPALLYIFSYRAWFASETSVYRHAATDGTIASDSVLQLFPDAVAGWLYYHLSVLEFHSELTSSGGHSHPWDSKPWSWLAATRPVLYYSSTGIDCAAGSCRSMIYLFGTPIIWWLTVPVLLWGLWRVTIGRDRRFVIPLVAFGAGFIPWLINFDRQMYFFYATALVPFTIVLLALALGHMVGGGRRLRFLHWISLTPITSGTFVVIIYLSAVVAMFAYFSPILYGVIIPDWYFQQIMWLPSWL
ncbi:dolichyl-phosphate-mannose--protein mannosyltransferase [Corynebacterium yudongzhengii]|uniref:Polyprenol-phosphate-mannose--protein mannosyltransferase n=1 Tax=Corynebacterium yudongzhengii TaxID=2080740 RepID=A0A2U1T7W5_9CORY|nr:phospholipid carrier-dependent glycosyltransferase [Corynebacterium yudongzhengii]AWB82292.1 dolichyl-phosphate-mannose--protein mannosyltransferase [Corynebacterium yudongzhengii]PWC02089.1 phospholipid carrier-dependent glycosyltransferase [Corynebacterium yudongzhengii]